ncbi:enoyl-CoA hydratase-related protein [Cryptosporangium minutisporangium]|uniref:Crotonase/enoyl-CoA hydratase family protein n=1 Tax=Cryptosporangium minutisporangium TaxID=113569 RepID=A0ABP6SS14_9ACTN
MAAEPPVLVDDALGVRVITLNRPHVRNALDSEATRLLRHAVSELDERPDLKAGVLTGAGGTFCSGMDLTAFAAGEIDVTAGEGPSDLLPPTATPLLAAVEGWAAGGGLELALACDAVVAATDARLGLPEVRHGLFAAGGGLRSLAATMPRGAAMLLALTGEPMSAVDARARGLVAALTPPGQAVSEARRLAGLIARHPARGVEATKELLQLAYAGPQLPFTERQHALLGEVFTEYLTTSI